MFLFFFMLLITMCIFQIKSIISSEKWFNYVVTFFLKMTKIWVGRTTLNEEKKEDDLKAKKIYPTFCPDVKHAPMVSPGHNIVASFILEIIPLQVSCKTMIAD